MTASAQPVGRLRGTLRTVLGAGVYELPIALWALRPHWLTTRRDPPWIRVRNRGEQLLGADAGPGVKCDWQWTSSLHVARVFPSVGHHLLQRALASWPIRLEGQRAGNSAGPAVSFIIGHRGAARTPLLMATLASLAAQEGVPFEVLVVEQAAQPLLTPEAVPWVRLIQIVAPAEMPYNRGWAFNVGAREARGELLVFHDNDMLVPVHYARELWCRFREGYEVLNLKRLIFYLGEVSTRLLCGEESPWFVGAPDDILQNAEAGGSVGVAARTFSELGGFDERFVGWGGEDSEFWERAQTRKVYPWGYLPMIHLWHAPQPEKMAGGQGPGAERYRQVAARPVAERIAALSARPRGLPEGPGQELT